MYYITEFLSGGLITALFSYAASLYTQHPAYIKIIAFLWGMPILYFYILFISMSISEKVAIDVTYHALFGMLGSMFIMITTLLLLTYSYTYKYSHRNIIGINILYLFIVIHIYLWYTLYKT